MGDVSEAFVLGPGATRVEDAMLPFKLSAQDSKGALSICEFTLGPWQSGPVLHKHDDVDEGFYVVTGTLEVLFAEQAAYFASLDGPPDLEVLSEMGERHGAPTLGPPIRSQAAPEEPAHSGYGG